ncbi:MAG: AMP-binding protein [Pseudomonadota bacterium]|nr:AMP-binding protein [Pseudomonadota bacterium]
MSDTALPFLPTAPSYKLSPTAPALFGDRSAEWTSYSALAARVLELQAYFPLQTKDLIFCAAPRTVEGVTAYLAAAASGHAVGMIDVSTLHLRAAIDVYRPGTIIAPAGQSLPGYKTVQSPLITLEILRREVADRTAIHKDLYLLLLTSGSTGSPKGVRLSYQNIASNTAAIAASLGLTPEGRALVHLPLSYSYGLSVLHMQLASGGSCLLTEQGMMSRTFWQLAQAERATVFSGVPYHYEMLAKLGLDRIQADSFRMFTQAGGAMSPELTLDVWRGIEARQGQLFIMYGQTEASPRISCLAFHDHPAKLGSCGRVLQGGEISIEDEEVVYTGPNVMMGYAESRSDLALGDVLHRRLATGDLGYLDDDHYLFITGRRQRFAKLYGFRISLDDIETLAGRHGPSAALEIRGMIVVVTTIRDEAMHERIRKSILEATGLSSAWLEIRWLEGIPLEPNGKVAYGRLREGL